MAWNQGRAFLQDPLEGKEPREVFTRILGAAVWKHGYGREAAMTVLKRPSFGPGMCRKPCLGKCQAGKKNKLKSQLKKR